MTDASPPENEWCARVWRAMAKECGEACKQAFRVEFETGWPAKGCCSACERTWTVHKNKLTK